MLLNRSKQMKQYLILLSLIVFFTNNISLAKNQFDGMKHDSSQPVELEADKLEIFQEKNKAIFTGSVVAKQGEISIKSDLMHVYFTSKKDKNKSKDKGQQNSVEKVEALGNVLLLTGKEQAKGNKGVFNIVTKTITLTGDVVLSNEQTTLKASKFTYNIDSGVSRLIADKKQDGKKRVKGIFIPENN